MPSKGRQQFSSARLAPTPPQAAMWSHGFDEKSAERIGSGGTADV